MRERSVHVADEVETLIEWFNEDRVRVIEQRIPPGGSTGFHRHEEDYVVVPITNGRAGESVERWRFSRSR